LIEKVDIKAEAGFTGAGRGWFRAEVKAEGGAGGIKGPGGPEGGARLIGKVKVEPEAGGAGAGVAGAEIEIVEGAGADGRIICKLYIINII
jgi:hypothetical protein